LVGIIIAATPDLNTIAIGLVASTKVKALALVRPGEAVNPLIVTPLLVRVICRAGPNLQLRAINKPSLWYVQAFGAEHFNDASAESPFLRSRASAWLDGNYGGVGIGGSG